MVTDKACRVARLRIYHGAYKAIRIPRRPYGWSPSGYDIRNIALGGSASGSGAEWAKLTPGAPLIITAAPISSEVGGAIIRIYDSREYPRQVPPSEIA